MADLHVLVLLLVAWCARCVHMPGRTATCTRDFKPPCGLEESLLPVDQDKLVDAPLTARRCRHVNEDMSETSEWRDGRRRRC